MDADKMYKEKSRCELHKNAIGQILEATTHKTNNYVATYLPSLKPSKLDE